MWDRSRPADVQRSPRSEMRSHEGARIEACAASGRALASKELLERLEPDDAAALELAPDRVTYTPLADLPTATEKARRYPPAIAVCEV
jgi:hypothetical protein